MLFSTTYGTIYSRTATSDSLTLGRCHSIHGVHEITKMNDFFMITHTFFELNFLHYYWAQSLKLFGFREYTSAPSSHLIENPYFFEMASVERFEH